VPVPHFESKPAAAPAAPKPAAAPAPKPVPPAAPAAHAPAHPTPRPHAARRDAHGRATGPVPVAHEPAAAPAARGGRSILPFAIGGGAVVLAVLGFAAWRFLSPAPAPAPTPTPSAIAQATPVPAPLPTETPAAALEPTPEPTVAPTPTPAPTPTARPGAAPTPTPKPTPTARPTPTPTPRTAAAPPTTPAAPSGPSPAAQAQALVAQAEQALAGKQYDQAIGQADAALRLDAGNARASAIKAEAAQRRDLARRRFVSGRTTVAAAKGAKADLGGFETADAEVRTADFSGRLEFEMSPPAGIDAGAAWTLRVYAVNDGRKPIKVTGLSITTNANGTAAGGPVSPQTREIAPTQRVLVGETSGTWAGGTTAWTAEAVLSANKGDSLKNTLSWR
jgi:hypothetical protein